MEAQSNAEKYKSVLKKVRPVNEAIPQDLNPPLERPELSRDPYETPLSPNPPLFIETLKVTEERISMINFGPSGLLSEEETNLLKNVILLREKSITFCEEERGILKHSDGKPYKIPVISHEPWQKKPIPIPKSILPQFIELVRERIRTGLYEQSTSSYNSPVFCVEKPNGKLRIVHDLQDLNKVTINYAGLPPNADEFLTRLPRGAKPSVAFYQAQITWILKEEIPEHLGVLIDDGGIKGPRSTYQHETLKENPLIRRFFWEYAVTLERILVRIEEAGLTTSGSKFSCCVPALDLVGHVVSFGGRKISKQKINKIQNCPRPTTKKEVRGFLGLCAYVRMSIKDFSQVAAPLRRLKREDVLWKWDEKCEEAFIRLRKIVGEEITLKTLNYDKGSGKIKLAIDSSYIAAGAPKLELCGVARILKKLQTILWGKHFEPQLDAEALIEIINTPCLPNAPMARWVASIQRFSFDLVHKPGKTFNIPDGLSRRPKGENEDESERGDFDEEEECIKPHPGFGLKEVNTTKVGKLSRNKTNNVEIPIKQEVFGKHMQEYLNSLKKPQSIGEE
ncbi:hypothetical protein O181_061415 [Austropuccinia psidii MF-1]|uniref:Reverse transcriptase/retrotransposon-derived protein RNase H-like domain-containing protein n=1 Tax=Austropuccinia psidii MF-1 TaxID=1389203 RepID=A0A9Q3EF51_9BASI|nr:hypothetical protein [Austropuccinia psidii MF-1]